MFQWIIYWLILTAAVFVSFTIVPGLNAEKKSTYFMVAAVYGILNALIWFLFGWFLTPFSYLSLGLIGWVVNAFVLILTDKLIEEFKSESAGAVMMGALLIVFFSWLFKTLVF